MSECCTSCVAAVIPSLNPDRKFQNVIGGLVEAGFEHIIIVDDGSDEAHLHFFEEAASYPQCTVLHHECNHGKGRALKTAFHYVLDNLPEVRGVVTADGDGQHLTADIIACGEKMLESPGTVIMGCRDFNLPGVPKKNGFGNKLTSFMFLLCCGIRLSDTQTGLRAIPREHLPLFCEIEGERFEYETNMLLQMKRHHIGFIEQSIATVYDPENYSTHYNVFRDSWRIFKVMFRFILSSAGSTVLDLAAFALIFGLIRDSAGNYAELIATLTARLISSVANFLINYKLVFKNKGNSKRALCRYYCLCIPQALASAGLVTLLNDVLRITSTGLATVIKMVVDIILFFISYSIQREWVFDQPVKKH